MGSSLTREREKKSFFSCSSEKKINKKSQGKGAERSDRFWHNKKHFLSLSFRVTEGGEKNAGLD